jgi:hypothetical protein
MSPKFLTTCQRLYCDFLMSSRLPEYRALLGLALHAGYRGVSLVEGYRQLCSDNGNSGDTRLLILRHDIDSDQNTAHKMWEIEKNLGLHATYYFRLSTADFDLMREIEAGGGEASYHYEELAILAKGLRLDDCKSLVYYLPPARQLFKLNLELFRARSGLAMKTVASHGDFINRQLGICNREILRSAQLRQELGIEVEAYDEALMDQVSYYASDIHASFVADLTAAIARKLPVICMLTHPRNWCPNRRENMRMIGERIADAASFALKKNLTWISSPIG